MKHLKKLLLIFNVSLITKFINLYIGILALVALFITIGWFNITNNPHIEILNPTYVFNMNRINSVLQKNNLYKIFPVDETLNNKFCSFGEPEGAYKQNSLEYILPYFRVDANKFQREHSLNPRSFLYHTGISDEIDITKHIFNNATTRTENQKRLGLSTLLIWDMVNKFSSESLTSGPILKVNPLKELQNKKNVLPDDVFNTIGSEFVFATTIYSIISICNYSNEDMHSINIFLNDVLNTGMLEVIGWTEGGHTIELKSRGPNFRFNIEHLPKNQSIEVLFRGNKKIRDNDIRISSVPFSSIDSSMVVCVLVVLFLLLLIVFALDKKRKSVFPSIV